MLKINNAVVKSVTKREILTKKVFEVPNPRTYTLDRTKEQISFYERLLEIQKTVHDVQEQASNSVHDVAFSLAKSAYILVQLHLKDFSGFTRYF